MIGIYKIQSIIKPERLYIGSANNIAKRWYCHLNKLYKNQHHSIKLQRHFNKYGKNDFIFSIIIGCNREDLIITEQYFIDVYKPYFNINPNAKSCLGVKRSEEHKNKLRIIHTGSKLSEESKRKISIGSTGINNGFYGKKHSSESLSKMSNSKKGKRHTAEALLNMSKAQKGKIISEETKKKIGIARKKWKLSEISKHKMSESAKLRKRYPHSEETKKKMSIARFRYNERINKISI